MRLKLLILIFFPSILFPLWGFSQTTGHEFMFPDIPGYKTLKCDLHMHTVFSDGDVWPTVRVSEAVNEGLDAICITEHLEYYSHSQYISGDHNSSYEIAKPFADKKDLILIRGAEITKGMPPGHFNFLFIEDANTIDSVDWKIAILQANEQGAFVFWNHPGWRQENEIPIWYEEHSWLLSEGLIQGIEIVNENSYYPLAHKWGIDSNLSLLGNSDIHDPLDMFFDRSKGEHRPLTLVFALERTAEGIREALDKRRTAIYYKDLLIGDEQYLKELFYNSVKVYTASEQIADDNPNATRMIVNNHSSLAFKLVYKGKSGKEYGSLILRKDQVMELKVPEGDGYGSWLVKNVLVSPDKCLEVIL